MLPDCPYGCDPADVAPHRADCTDARRRGPLPSRDAAVAVVDLPLCATEDRVAGALDIERALVAGEARFQPGLLARANRGFLHLDEVNLLEDHIGDLLVDVAASGKNVVEREGLSLRQPARFVPVGSCNPDEGELRPIGATTSHPPAWSATPVIGVSGAAALGRWRRAPGGGRGDRPGRDGARGRHAVKPGLTAAAVLVVAASRPARSWAPTPPRSRQGPVAARARPGW